MNTLISLVDPFGLFLLALIILGILVEFVVRFTQKASDKILPSYHYRRREYFMTRHEAECYKALVQAVGNEYFIFPQAHLPTFIDERLPGQSRFGARAHIHMKSVDFVLCDKENISPVLAIELDDWSHDLADRKKRDVEVERILEEAKMPLLRILDSQNLAEKISQKLSEIRK
jgi:Protein of unknown function (DUF2726)